MLNKAVHKQKPPKSKPIQVANIWTNISQFYMHPWLEEIDEVEIRRYMDVWGSKNS